MSGELFDPALFRAEVQELMRRNRDPELHDACWDYLEGRIDRRGLRRRPAYRNAIGAFHAERFAELEQGGVDLKAVRAYVREVVEAEDEANGTDLAGRILTPEGE
jgi:hypothetical protein